MERDSVKNKLELLNLARKLGNVLEACQVTGYSRDSYYRFKKLYENGGELALQNITRRKPNMKNRLNAAIEKAIVALALEKPEYGQLRVSTELKKRSVSVSPSTVRNIWLRHNLETLNKRMKAFERNNNSKF